MTKYQVGMLVQIDYDGLRATGFIRRASSSRRLNSPAYEVEIVTILPGSLVQRSGLHACGGAIPSGNGWTVRDSGIIRVLNTVKPIKHKGEYYD